MNNSWARKFITATPFKAVLDFEKYMRTTEDKLAKLSKKDRQIIQRDLSQFKDGMPEDMVYKPGTWCGCKPITLSAGEEGVVEFLDYVAAVNLKRAIATATALTGVTALAFVVLCLHNVKETAVEALEPCITTWFKDADGYESMMTELPEKTGACLAPLFWKGSFISVETGSFPNLKGEGTVSQLVSVEATADVLAAAGSVVTAATVAAALTVQHVLSNTWNRKQARIDHISTRVHDLASEEGCSPSVIATAKEISSLAEHKPATIQDLGRLKEFPLNSARVEKYGEKLVEFATELIPERPVVSEEACSFTPVILTGALNEGEVG